jgi:hypothetical protein
MVPTGVESIDDVYYNIGFIGAVTGLVERFSCGVVEYDGDGWCRESF